MLLTNYSNINRNTQRVIGFAFSNPVQTIDAVILNNFYVGDHVVTSQTDRSAWYNGYSGDGAFYPAMKSGGIGSCNQVNGSGSVTAGNLAGGKNAEASLTGSGTISSATAQLVISMTASLVGSGTITLADLKAYLNAVANIVGSGTISAAALLAKGHMASPLVGSGTISTATPSATGELEADIRGYSDLTPEGIRDKVWEAILDSGYSAEEIMRLLASVAAGDASGLEGASPVFRDLGDTKDRIVATYSSGNRNITSLDVD